MKNQKLVLAFSGGLDTSYCVKYLQTVGYDVYSVIVNTGGFSQSELDEIQEKAHLLGVKEHLALDETQKYYKDIVKYLIFGNVLKNGTYPLSVSSERVHQALAIASYAKEIGAGAIAHGSTGAGNDQVRFDTIFRLIAPELKVITPIRDQQLCREQEISFLKEKGIEMAWEKAKYSVNKGLWGTSIGGVETLTSHQALPEEAYLKQLETSEAQTIKISFNQGELSALNDEKMDSVSIIQKLDILGGKYAIGRDTHVGDTIIGIKGRVGFEAAAALMIIAAHGLLEKHTLSKWQLHWKEQLGTWYGMFLHECQYFDPCMRDIEQFLSSTQKNVTGDVHLTLHPYRFTLDGIESPFDLMNSKFGQYGEMNLDWSGEDVKGFTKIISNGQHIIKSVQNG